MSLRYTSSTFSASYAHPCFQSESNLLGSQAVVIGLCHLSFLPLLPGKAKHFSSLAFESKGHENWNPNLITSFSLFHSPCFSYYKLPLSSIETHFHETVMRLRAKTLQQILIASGTNRKEQAAAKLQCIHSTFGYI